MRSKIEKETLIIIIAVAVAVGALIGVAYLILNDGEPRVKVVPAVSSEIIDDIPVTTQPTEQQTVHALKIDGEWFRTGVSQECPATLEISETTENSFKFTLHARNQTKSGSISGEAYFGSVTEATFTNEETNASIIFTLSDSVITISHTESDTALGCDDTVTFDGKYTPEQPVYTDVESKTTPQITDNTGLTKNLRKDSKITNNIKQLLRKSDYNLYASIMTEENIRESFPESEAQNDNDGNVIWVDSELNAVKYYAVLNGASTEILLMCKPDGKVYVAIFEVDEVRYYTNDSAYAKKAPASIKSFAESRPAPIKYMS